MVADGNSQKIAENLNFPLSIHGQEYSEKNFLNNKDESINFFTPYVRKEINKGTVDDLIHYEGRSELASDGCPHLPKDSPIYEFDIINDKGSPAMHLIFGKNGTRFQLFCVLQ